MDKQYVLNPNISYSIYKIGNKPQNIQIAAPRKGDSIQFSSFHKNKNIEEFKGAYEILNGKIISCLNNKVKSLFYDKNIIVNRKYISNFPTILKRPKKTYRNTPILDSNAYRLNENAFISKTNNFPTELSYIYKNKLLEKSLSTKDSVLWVKGFYNGIWYPYLLDLVEDQYIFNLFENKSIKNLNSSQLLILRKMEVLVPMNHKKSNKYYFSIRNRKYCKNDSIVIKNFINPYINHSLSKYYSDLQDEGLLRYGDYQSSTRYWAHNEVICRFIHFQIHPIVERIVGKTLIPTFSSYVSYQEGSTLKTHIDRPQAHLTVGILLGHFNNKHKINNNWPLYVEKYEHSNDYHKYLAQESDMVIFQGSKLMHYRLEIPQGCESKIMLFHFADGNFNGELL